MRYRFQFRRYRLPFRTVVRTAHGPWAEREGLIVRVEELEDAASGHVGFGEAAPIPWFGTETVDEDEVAARDLGEWIEGSAAELLERLPARCACLRNAVASALAGIAEAGADPGLRVGERTSLGLAALLPAGRPALDLIETRAEIGFRVFKWKVGVDDIADELVLLDDVCARLPQGAKLRLDANGAWDRRQAERWLERCAERPVEFVEQPCFAAASASTAERKRVEDVLLGLATDFPTPVALDESLVGERDVERWTGAGWPGVFVVKPALIADVDTTLARLAKARAAVVFSSALETAVGARAALRAAFAWPGEAKPGQPPQTRALGFGVWPLFADARFNAAAVPLPYVRGEDMERIDLEAAWNALN